MMEENGTQNQDAKEPPKDKQEALRLETKAPLVLDKKVQKEPVNQPKFNKKKLWLALALSVIPGLGHFYVGAAKMGLVASFWMFAVFVSGVIVFSFGANFLQGFSFSFAVLGLAGVWLIGYALIFLDVCRFMLLPKSKPPSTTSPAVWYTFAITSIVTFVIFLYTPNFYIGQARDNSMLPTLGKGDYYIYNFDNTYPNRGEVVMFENPVSGLDGSLKSMRVMALEREQIKVENEVVYVNGKPLLRARKPGVPMLETTDGRATVFLERFNDGAALRSYEVLELTNIAPFDNSRTYFVPPENLFVMGDNRDASLDSRMTQDFGFLPIAAVVGRPLMVIYSSDSGRNGRTFR